MSDSSSICLSCGLCCDGTLIGHVQLGKEELPTLKDLLEIERTDESGFFLQPCKSYCDGCTIYLNRPKQCANFNCGLLKSVEQKEVAFTTAVDVINDVKLKKSAIEKKLNEFSFETQSQSFHFKMTELKNVLAKKKSESTLTQSHLELSADLESLDKLLSQKFGVSLF